MDKKTRKVIVAISGGVDSSAATLLLKKQGYDVTGVFMHFWKEGKAAENKCCSDSSLADARRVCQVLGIPFYTINFAQAFKDKIVDDFISEYAGGRTPNPCVRCNKMVKIGGLIKKARTLGFDYIATGHYASVREENGVFQLYKAKDSDKDQSYFLCRLGQEELKDLLLPLANLTKPEVRKIAAENSLPTAQKSESQEVCFIPEKSHNDFLKRYIKLKTGKIIDLDGKELGEHQGLPLYTIGQRKGIEIGGTGPYYVVGVDYEKNILQVANEFNHPSLYKNELVAWDVNWVAGKAPLLPCACEAVIRYRHKPVACTVSEVNGNISVKFKEPQRAITPGQTVAFYDGDEVLGGGTILDKKILI